MLWLSRTVLYSRWLFDAVRNRFKNLSFVSNIVFKPKSKAIQLSPTTDSNAYSIWTPNDTSEEWLLAKMFFNSSNGQVLLLTLNKINHF